MSGRRFGTPRRRLALYLAAVAMPTLVVLGLGLQAVGRQREAINTLTATARRVQEALVVEQVERRLLEAAETAIGHLASAGLVALASAGDQEQAARAWPLVQRLLVEHPVMQHVFVMEDGESLYPRATPLVPNHLDAWIAAEPPRPAMSFRYAIDRAETLDAQQAWLGAAAWYRTGSRAEVARRLHSPDLTGDERRKYAEVIAAETQRLAQLIEGVIDFSRVEQGARTYRLVPGRLNAVVAEAAERYRVFLESHGFGFDVQLDPLAPPVSFDADAASQAVLNLLDNAYKYSGESRHIALRLHTTSTRVVVEIVDHGRGILPDEATRLFEQFERGSTHPERGGYGLGLYLVRHTMEAHGGTVELGRDPEGRTVARLLFPICHREA